MFDGLLRYLRLTVEAGATWLCLLAGAVTVFYAGAGVGMVFGKLSGSPWSEFFLVRLGFWGVIFVAGFLVRTATHEPAAQPSPRP